MKKAVKIALVTLLAFCGWLQADVKSLQDLNEMTIVNADTVLHIKPLIDQAVDKKAALKHVVECITENNISMLYNGVIDTIIEYDRSVTKILVKSITKNNIHKIDWYITWRIMFTDENVYSDICACITPDNIKLLNQSIVECIVGIREEIPEVIAQNIIEQLGNPQEITVKRLRLAFAKNEWAKKLCMKYINSTTLPKMPTWFISRIIHKDKSIVAAIVKQITEHNIMKIDTKLILSLIEQDKTITRVIAEKITENNINDDTYFICQLIRADKKVVPVIARNITENNIKDFKVPLFGTASIIGDLIAADATVVQTIMKVITKNNCMNLKISLTGESVISQLAEADKSVVDYFVGLIDENNINNIPVCDVGGTSILWKLFEIDPSIVRPLIKLIKKNNIKNIRSSVIKEFVAIDTSIIVEIAKLIDGHNIHDINLLTIVGLAEADSTLVPVFFKYYTQHRKVTALDPSILEYCMQKNPEIKKLVESKINVATTLHEDPLKIYLLAGAPGKNYVWAKHKFASTQDKHAKNGKSASSKHFMTMVSNGVLYYKCQWTGNLLDSYFTQHLKPEVRSMLLRALYREKQEHKKGRITFVHSQNSSLFLAQQAYAALYELFLGKAIDKEEWWGLRFSLPGTNLPYVKGEKIVTDGRTESDWEAEREYMHFMNAFLFGNMFNHGSNSLNYLLTNSNVNRNKLKFTLEKIFELFGWKKYYEKYKSDFDVVEKIALKQKYGTLLMHSLTKQAAKDFVYVAQPGGEKIALKIKGQDVSDVETIRTTVQTDPKAFDNWKSIDAHEYVFLKTDDHPTDKKKMGLLNPLNGEVRTYHFTVENMSDVKMMLADIFAKIKRDMAQEKVGFKVPVIGQDQSVIQSKL